MSTSSQCPGVRLKDIVGYGYRCYGCSSLRVCGFCGFFLSGSSHTNNGFLPLPPSLLFTIRAWFHGRRTSTAEAATAQHPSLGTFYQLLGRSNENVARGCLATITKHYKRWTKVLEEDGGGAKSYGKLLGERKKGTKEARRRLHSLSKQRRA